MRLYHYVKDQKKILQQPKLPDIQQPIKPAPAKKEPPKKTIPELNILRYNRKGELIN